jgi:hypothetical protein
MMILRGQSMPALWERIFGDAGGRGRFNATYVSPGKVRTAQALAISLSATPGPPPARACLIMFETLAGRS